MKIKDTEYYSELKFRDPYGKVTIRVQKDLSQIALETANGDCYADIDRNELEAIRDFINLMLTN